jgi:hypothetical protein
MSCTAECPAWSGSCFQGCLDATSEPELNKLATLNACTQLHCADCYDLGEGAAEECLDTCVVLYCSSYLGLCITPTGEGSCEDLVDCIYSCGDAGECQLECFQVGLIPGHSTLFEHWLTCLRRECPQGSLPDLDSSCVISALANECDEPAGFCTPNTQ